MTAYDASDRQQRMDPVDPLEIVLRLTQMPIVANQLGDNLVWAEYFLDDPLQEFPEDIPEWRQVKEDSMR